MITAQPGDHLQLMSVTRLLGAPHSSAPIGGSSGDCCSPRGVSAIPRWFGLTVNRVEHAGTPYEKVCCARHDTVLAW
jgi:hypothetical protein